MLRSSYSSLLHWSLTCPGSGRLHDFQPRFLGRPLIGSDFFRRWIPVKCGSAPAGTRIEQTEVIFAGIEREIRQVIPP